MQFIKTQATTGFLLATSIVVLVNQSSIATTYYVSVDGGAHIAGAHIAPYTNWPAAATNIQPAIDAASHGDIVQLDNDHFYTFAQLQVSNSISIIGQKDAPESVVIQGEGTHRMFYLGSSSCIIDSVTIKNGYAPYGAGIYCASTNPVITGCAIVSNSAAFAEGWGGGIMRGTVISSIMANNSATNNGGGSYGSIIRYSTLMGNYANQGGGAYLGDLQSCVVSNNTADLMGGGAYGATLDDCLLLDNAVLTLEGGGAFQCNLTDCTLRNNSAWGGGGASYSVLDSCFLISNSASYIGGGIRDGEAHNCTFTENVSGEEGGGSYYSILSSCTLISNSAIHGGGIYGGSLTNCTLAGNRADAEGGGAYQGFLANCFFIRNSAVLDGGGAWWSDLVNCTLRRNSAGASGGGVYAGRVENSIIYYNTASNSADNCAQDELGGAGEFRYCCTTPITNAASFIAPESIITNEPGFADSDSYVLTFDSVCIDAGTATGIVDMLTMDIVGTARPLDGKNDGIVAIDIGCQEYLNPLADSDNDTMPDGWENDSGLNPASSNAPSANADSDPFRDIEEYIADTDPTDTQSYFAISDITHASPITVSFISSTNRLYTLKRSSNILAASWITVSGQGLRQGVDGPDLMIDTNSVDQSFYRVHVELP